MNIMHKVTASAIATGALLVNMALPAFAVTIEVSGNGSGATSTATTNVSSSVTVVQDNTANVTNNVSAVANTGANEADDNTGGDVSVTTGNASTTVGVSNTLNSNSASVEGCCDQDVNVLISDNGEDSENDVTVEHENTTGLFQNNVANVNNNVNSYAGSGSNSANGNTNGDVTVSTGNASTTALVLNTANVNSTSFGGGTGTGGTISAQIMGNGSDSYNTLGLSTYRSLELLQDNYANLENDVDAVSETGANEAEDNTGGDTGITTLNADTTVGVDNLVNFNSADLDCECLFDVLAMISDNGEDSENDITALLVDEKAAFQANVWTCSEGLRELNWDYEDYDPACNNVDAYAGSGDNTANDNTGDDEDGGSADVNSGNADTEVLIENTGNANVVGDAPEFPDFDLDFDLGLNWLSMWSLLTGDTV